MKKNKTIPDWAWKYYQAKQTEALRGINDDADEPLTYIVRLFTEGKIPDGPGQLDRLLDNHLAGERQKARRRLVLLERLGEADSNQQPASAEASWSECLRAIRAVLKPTQWDLLASLARGDSHRQLSTDRQVSISSTKSAVCRIRKRLRALNFCA